MEKFEKLKKFRDLDSLKLINKDKSTEKLIDKFKDLQDIYIIIRTYIKNNDKKWIFSQKDEVFYVFLEKIFTTTSLNTSDKGVIENHLLKISNNTGLEFRLPKRNIIERLGNIYSQKSGVYFISYGDWYDENYNLGKIRGSNEGYHSLGVYSVDKFLDSLDTRNQSLKLETNILKEIDKKISENGIEISEFTDIDKFIKDLVEIKVFDDTNVRNLLTKMQEDNNEVSPKELLKRYKASLLESKELKDFEVILNYNLLDTDIINGEANSRKFRNLVNLYKTYKDYISCMYIKDNTEDTVELIFNADKIISSAENRNELFNGIEILYKNNDLKITKEEIYNDKNIFYFENGDMEVVYNPKSEEKISVYYFKNGDEEFPSWRSG